MSPLVIVPNRPSISIRSSSSSDSIRGHSLDRQPMSIQSPIFHSLEWDRSGINALTGQLSVAVHQKKKSCLQELILGCEANNEVKLLKFYDFYLFSYLFSVCSFTLRLPMAMTD